MSEEMTPEAAAPARKPRGLGMGLSALLGDPTGAESAQSRDISTTNVDIDRLRRNPNQPRRTFDEADLETLTASIRTHGVVQPLLVRPIADDPGRYEIVAGERRWRAAQRAGLTSVPVLVRDVDDLGTLEIAIVENVQRADLDPIEEALAFQQLIDRFGRTQAAVAEAVGKSRAHIANTLRLLALPDEVQDLIRTGALSAGHGRAALGSTSPVEAAQTMMARGLSVRDAERLVQAEKTKGSRAGAVSRETVDDGDASALAADLSAALGLPVNLRHSGRKGGTLSIDYRTLEQLDDLCRRLTHPAR